MTDDYDASTYLAEEAKRILSELADRLDGEISGKDECAIGTAVQQALVKGCLVGYAAVVTTADVSCRLPSGEVGTGTVVIDRALEALRATNLDYDEWAERFG